MNKNAINQIKKITAEDGFLSMGKNLAPMDCYTVFFKKGTMQIVDKFLETLPVKNKYYTAFSKNGMTYEVTETSPFKVTIQNSKAADGMYESIIETAEECSLWILLVSMVQRKENGKRSILYSYQELFQTAESEFKTLNGEEYIYFDDNPIAENQAIAARNEIVKTDLEPIVRMWLVRDMKEPVEPDIDEPGYPDYWYSHEYWLKRVIRNAVSIMVVPKKLKTRDIWFEAVRQNGWTLEWVPETLKTEQMCLEAVRHPLHNDNFGDKQPLKFVPEKFKTEQMYLEAVKSSGTAFEFVPEKFKTAEICLYAVRNGGWKTLDKVPEKFKTAEICLEAVKTEGLILMNVPEKFKTAEICLEAVKSNCEALKYVPEKIKTAELCLEAVQNGGMALKWVPETLKTAELCLEAVKSIGAALKWVPETLKTELLRKIAEDRK